MLLGTRRALLRGRRAYYEKVLSYGPIAYWPLWETSGAAAVCQVNAAQNGTYIGATLANGLSPSGLPCPLFDGVGDWVDVQSVTLAGAFDGDEGSIMGWLRVFDATFWTDGVYHYFFNFMADANNGGRAYKGDVNNKIDCAYVAGGVTEWHTHNGVSMTEWFQYVLTWSASSDRTRAYINAGVPQASATLGIWAGPLTSCLIGSYTAGTPLSFKGWLSDFAVFGRELTADEITDLYTV